MLDYLTLDDLKNLRQLDSITPGHPEITTPGVDMATGPLGQGIAMGVGMALAERYYEAYFNTEDIKLFDNTIKEIIKESDFTDEYGREVFW